MKPALLFIAVAVLLIAVIADGMVPRVWILAGIELLSACVYWLLRERVH